MEITYIKKGDGTTTGYLSYEAGNGESVIWFGEQETCKTEADAREAAELLKAFFEAKSKGISARLVCGEMIPGIVGGVIDTQRPKNTVIDQMNEDQRDHHAEALNKQFGNSVDGLIADRIWGNRANNMTLEQYEVFTIAHNAALIFAHNMHNTDERRAVQSAAKILRHAQESE